MKSIPLALVALALTHALHSAVAAEPKVEADAKKPVVTAESDGSFVLHAKDATVHGKTLRYEPEPEKNCLGFWTNPNDWADWKFEVAEPGEFIIEIWQGCGRGQGGSEVRVETGGESFDFVVEDTGHFQNFKPRQLGTLTLKPGVHTLAVKPQTKKAAAVMDVRYVKLLPVAKTKTE